MFFEHLFSDFKSVLFPRDEIAALPVMDGPLTPNRRLDDAELLGEEIPGCDDIASGGDGRIYVSSGRQVLQLSGANFGERSLVAEFDQDVTALAHVGGVLYVGVAGLGVLRLEQGREVARLTAADGKALRCPTAIAVLPDGRVAIAEGSTQHRPDQWCRDLMERRALGRILIADAGLNGAVTRLDALAWPYGLTINAKGDELWISESWQHRVLAVALHGPDKPTRVVLRNLPGYPARLYADGNQGYWLSVFAVRTHLVELVLRERRYRDEMLATIAPEFWIAPALATSGHYLEPLQGGTIRKLGVMKPWAPPRSYGLVVQLSAQGECLGSLHSRVGGIHHGITAARVLGNRLLVASKGSGHLLAIDQGSRP